MRRPRKREEERDNLIPLSAPHRLIKGLHKEVDYRHQGIKTEHSSPLPATSRKKKKTCLAGLKSAGGYFFFKYKTVRPEAVRTLKTDPERSEKANTNS